MSDNSIIFPGMIKPLRLARVYGFLVEIWDGVYRPGGSQPACSTVLARKLVEGGWLAKYTERYEPTERPRMTASCV
jgi:hypothetical protein